MNKTIFYLLMLIVLCSLVSAADISTDRTDYYWDGTNYLAELIGGSSADIGFDGDTAVATQSLTTTGWTITSGAVVYNPYNWDNGNSVAIFFTAASQVVEYTLSTINSTFNGSVGISFNQEGLGYVTFYIIDTVDTTKGMYSHQASCTETWCCIGGVCDNGIPIAIQTNHTFVANFTAAGTVMSLYIDGSLLEVFTGMQGLKTIKFGILDDATNMRINDVWISNADRPMVKIIV